MTLPHTSLEFDPRTQGSISVFKYSTIRVVGLLIFLHMTTTTSSCPLVHLLISSWREDLPMRQIHTSAPTLHSASLLLCGNQPREAVSCTATVRGGHRGIWPTLLLTGSGFYWNDTNCSSCHCSLTWSTGLGGQSIFHCGYWTKNIF